MAAPRAVWKGFMKLGSVTCGVKLVGATTEAGKLHFRVLNRKTRNPVRATYLDEATEQEVETEQQLKGYELDTGEYLTIEPDEVKALRMTSEHTLEIDEIVDLAEIDQIYLDKPYFLIPADGAAAEAFAVIREALKRKKAAARSCVVLYGRGREVVIQAEGNGLMMTTLRPHREVVAAESVFEGLKKQKLDEEMIEIASLLIDKKAGKFDPDKFEDRYEETLIAMIQAKIKGKKPPKAVPAPKENVVNLASVLRKSLKKEGIKRSIKSGAGSKQRKSA